MNKTEGSEIVESHRNEIIESHRTEEKQEIIEQKEFNKELIPLYRLEEKITKSMEKRKETGERVKLVKREYDNLKSEIKKFLKRQIVSSNQLSSKKKIRVKKTI